MSTNLPILCFSHLRWNFVYQRPQHLLSRFGKKSQVLFIEEPIRLPNHSNVEDGARLEIVRQKDSSVRVVTMYISGDLSFEEETNIVSQRIQELLNEQQIGDYIAWFYSPMFLRYTKGLKPYLSIYDCMDELAAFNFAPPEIKIMERLLLDQVDIVFTGGKTLYELKKHSHPEVYYFPSSIDKHHFAKARQNNISVPVDQEHIPHPRLGYHGVIDERIDLPLLAAIAEQRPNWHFIMIGPTAKISPSDLPRRANIYYLGQKQYAELPQYLAGWDIAFMPFALNASTRYISPTKTPEYLSGGKPVLSTAINDVVDPYGNLGLVEIISSPDEFIRAAERILSGQWDKNKWLKETDDFLSHLSWDITFGTMLHVINQSLESKKSKTLKNGLYV